MSAMKTPSPHAGKKRGETPSSSPGNEPLKVPKRQEISPGSLQSPDVKVGAGVTYKDRANIGAVVLDVQSPLATAVNDVKPSLASLSGEGRRCVIDHYVEAAADGASASSSSSEPAVGVQQQDFRYMFTTTDQRSAALDRSFNIMQEQLLKHAGLPAEVVALRTPVGVPSQDGVVCYGRVCCEAAEGKINKTSVLLEGGRMEGGQRVKLVLNEVAAYALFPGQFVVVEGINSSGGKMVVRNLCEGVPRPLPMSCPNELTKLQHGTGLNCQGGQPLRLMVGSGPFCCADNLDFEPLRDLLHQAAKLDPVEVLILTGPFLDAAHPQVASGMTQMTAEDGTLETIDLHTLFYYKVSGIIEAFFQENPELSLQIVLVPSLADAHHDHVYPQPPLGDRVAGGVDSPFFPGEKYFCLDIPKSKGGAAKRAVHCVGNPSMLKINEVVVGVTSTDVLMHLGKEEIAQRPVGSNRLERLVDHLVHQQSFYPLFPAPSGGGDACPLDMRFNDKWRMPVSPDVLLVPSRLATFARRLGNGTLAVNPGQLAKGASGGTYAKLTVHPMPAEQLKQATEGTAQPIRHQVAERTSLQIKRI